MAVAHVVGIKELNPFQKLELTRIKSTEPQKTQGRGKLWAVGATIRVGFLGGSAEQRNLVAQIAAEWTKYTNLSFQFVEAGDTDVRIAFEPTGGSWSFVGTDALAVGKKQPTMNLAWVQRESVLHEFGHVLGLIEEHQNPRADIHWNKEEIFKIFQGPPNFWSREQIEVGFFGNTPKKNLATIVNLTHGQS